MVEDNVKAQMRKGILDYCILGDPLAGGFLCSEDHRRTQGGGDDRGRRDAVSDPDAAEECGPAHLPVGRVPAGTPRKYYSLTDKGREYLASLDEAWENW